MARPTRVAAPIPLANGHISTRDRLADQKAKPLMSTGSGAASSPTRDDKTERTP